MSRGWEGSNRYGRPFIYVPSPCGQHDQPPISPALPEICVLRCSLTPVCEVLVGHLFTVESYGGFVAPLAWPELFRRMEDGTLCLTQLGRELFQAAEKGVLR